MWSVRAKKKTIGQTTTGSLPALERKEVGLIIFNVRKTHWTRFSLDLRQRVKNWSPGATFFSRWLLPLA